MKTKFPTRFLDSKSGFCFYHSKFGHRSNKCLKPCTFDENQAKSIIDSPVSSIPLSEAISLPKNCDKISGMLFLLNTDACSNFLPLHGSDTNKGETHSQFVTANGTPIKCYRKTNLEINIEFEKNDSNLPYKYVR